MPVYGWKIPYCSRAPPDVRPLSLVECTDHPKLDLFVQLNEGAFDDDHGPGARDTCHGNSDMQHRILKSTTSLFGRSRRV